ncbi:MAG: STAS domain-containing protein [Proteobacteria bacterium]|nr:STAS domain-containing protein [Pseudomonadota bacterium]
MFEYTITEDSSIKCITAKGRIDSLSSSDIQKVFDDLILSGERIFLVDMAAVNYVSSAGLRVFISTQKSLKKAGGEIILSGVTETVFEIFKMSGIIPLFRIVTSKDEIPGLIRKDSGGIEVITREIDGIVLEYIEMEQRKSSPLFVVGKLDKTADSSFTEEDVVTVKPSEMRFGCGLATLGDDYDEYKLLFGESMIANNTFFFYPAVKRSCVDFLINANKNSVVTYKFFHGFGFNGDYRYVLSFQGKNGPVDLSSIILSFFAISHANVIGICMIAETKGLWGMHIKQVPIFEQKPANGKSIFDSDNFSDWIDYPVEPSYMNNIIVATGIAMRDRSCLGSERVFLIPEGSNFHIHGGIFDKATIGSNMADFDKELMRVFNECQVYKIQHILGLSKFSAGMAAIVELEA